MTATPISFSTLAEAQAYARANGIALTEVRADGASYDNVEGVGTAGIIHDSSLVASPDDVPASITSLGETAQEHNKRVASLETQQAALPATLKPITDTLEGLTYRVTILERLIGSVGPGVTSNPVTTYPTTPAAATVDEGDDPVFDKVLPNDTQPK